VADTTKVTSAHLQRVAVVYIRQSTPGQVEHHRESTARQYALAERARELGWTAEQVQVIDEDLGVSGSVVSLAKRTGFAHLITEVALAHVGIVLGLEVSRLARSNADWYRLLDLCGVTNTLIGDSDGVYHPALFNDRLILGLKGTMSEYELSLLRQRGLAARDSKAKRGELRFALPPGYCWNELGQIDMDPDERITESIRLVFRKFQELGSARQVLLWLLDSDVKLPVMRWNRVHYRIEWHNPAYHTVLQILQHPMYAGAYVFGRTGQRTRVVDGRARKTEGHRKSMELQEDILHSYPPLAEAGLL